MGLGKWSPFILSIRVFGRMLTDEQGIQDHQCVNDESVS